jgi:hypothetical protein
MSERALTVREVADRFVVDPHAVLGWIKNGELRAVNCGRKPGAKKPRWRITPEALAEFERVRQAIPSQVTTRIRRRRQPAGIIDRY